MASSESAFPAPSRVLLVAPYAPRGGGMGRIMQYLAQETTPGVIFETVESRGGGGLLASVPHMARAARRILESAAGRERTIVHVAMADGASLYRKGALLLLARAAGLPCVLHLHAADIETQAARMGATGRAAARAIFRAADLCLVLGEPWRRLLLHDFGVDPSRVAVLRNGVPEAGLPPTPHEAPFHLLFLGNLLPRKGIPDLLHALALLPPGAPPWRLTAAGGGDHAPFHRLASSLGLGARVAFPGWVGRDETSSLLAHADALVLPSYHEALPLVLAEAASLGVPAVTTPVGAIAEVFADGDTALLVPPGDRACLASALARLLTDRALAARIGANARALYEAEFTMPRFVAALAGHYARLAA